MQKIQPVILAGGAGTRLWPLSRASSPKQLYPLVGDVSLLLQTVLRLEGMEKPLILAGEEHRFVIAEQLRKKEMVDVRLVLEPVGRNTAPAVAIAAELAAEDAVLLICPADHFIADVAGFQADVAIAAQAARAGRLATFGLKAARAETGYGYLEQGSGLPGVAGAYLLKSFIEKPAAALAEKLVAGGQHYWNSGIFVAQAGVLKAEIARLQPEISRLAKQAVAQAKADLDFLRLGAEAFAAMPPISFDVAIMEQSPLGALVPARFDWCDLGAWDALWEMGQKDAAGNVEQGNVVSLGNENSYIRSDGVLTAVMGLSNAVVVATQDAVLVTDKAHAQSMRALVAKLAEKTPAVLQEHRRTYRPWGYFERLDEAAHFKVKRLMIHPGGKISLQKHEHRAEHWVVVEGEASITLQTETKILKANESLYVPPHVTHRIENHGSTPLLIIEVQTGAVLSEEDIVRFEDNYGRI